MELIGKTTKKMAHNTAISQAALAAFVCTAAQHLLTDLFGVAFTTHVRVVSYVKGVLCMAADDPVYTQEIKIREQELCNTLRKKIDGVVVSGIRFKV